MKEKGLEKLLDLRNQLSKSLKAAGHEITTEGLFPSGRKTKAEADLCVTAPDGELYHIVIVNRRDQGNE